jgi:hypothetical protein
MSTKLTFNGLHTDRIVLHNGTTTTTLQKPTTPNATSALIIPGSHPTSTAYLVHTGSGSIEYRENLPTQAVNQKALVAFTLDTTHLEPVGSIIKLNGPFTWTSVVNSDELRLQSGTYFVQIFGSRVTIADSNDIHNFADITVSSHFYERADWENSFDGVNNACFYLTLTDEAGFPFRALGNSNDARVYALIEKVA